MSSQLTLLRKLFLLFSSTRAVKKVICQVTHLASIVNTLHYRGMIFEVGGGSASTRATADKGRKRKRRLRGSHHSLKQERRCNGRRPADAGVCPYGGEGSTNRSRFHKRSLITPLGLVIFPLPSIFSLRNWPTYTFPSGQVIVPIPDGTSDEPSTSSQSPLCTRPSFHLIVRRK